MVLEMRGGRMKRRGAMNSGICWGEELGGSLLQGEIPGLRVNIRHLGTAQKVEKSGGAGDGGRW